MKEARINTLKVRAPASIPPAKRTILLLAKDHMTHEKAMENKSTRSYMAGILSHPAGRACGDLFPIPHSALVWDCSVSFLSILEDSNVFLTHFLLLTHPKLFLLFPTRVPVDIKGLAFPVKINASIVAREKG